MSDDILNLELDNDIIDSLDNSDSFLTGAMAAPGQVLNAAMNNPKTTLSLLAASQIPSLAKTGFAKGIDTYGFGSNIQGSYQGKSKIAQWTNNLLMAGGGKRRNMPIEAIKSLVASGDPLELKAARTSLALVEEHMSKLKSAGIAIPEEYIKYHANLSKMVPERHMAQAILQKSLNQPINFEHGGQFIENATPQVDDDIKRALKNKGFSTDKPFTVYDVTHVDKTNEATKHMQSKLRAAHQQAPRLYLINKALKENRIDDAIDLAKNGTIKYKGKLINTGVPVNLVREGNGYVAKFNPHYVRGGKIVPVKEYVLGGHTQRVHYGRFKGFDGLHRTHTDVFDITSYSSVGEKGDNLWQKSRIAGSGEVGRKLGVHQPVVTVSNYTHRAPGGGRKKGSVDTVKRKSRKFVEAAAKGLGYEHLEELTDKKNIKNPKQLLKLAKLIATKGKTF